MSLSSRRPGVKHRMRTKILSWGSLHRRHQHGELPSDSAAVSSCATEIVRFMDKASASDTAKACVNVATVLLRDRHTLGISAPASETMIDHPPATWRRAMLRSAAGAQISRLLIVADNFPAKRMQSVFTRSTMISNPPPMLHQASCRRIVQPGGLQPGGSPCCNRRLV